MPRWKTYTVEEVVAYELKGQNEESVLKRFLNMTSEEREAHCTAIREREVYPT